MMTDPKLPGVASKNKLGSVANLLNLLTFQEITKT